MFSKLFDSCIILFLNILRVRQSYRPKRSSFSENEIYHASEVGKAIIFERDRVKKSISKHTSWLTTAGALETQEIKFFF